VGAAMHVLVIMKFGIVNTPGLPLFQDRYNFVLNYNLFMKDVSCAVRPNTRALTGPTVMKGKAVSITTF
jgi:hypothetical protein